MSRLVRRRSAGIDKNPAMRVLTVRMQTVRAWALRGALSMLACLLATTLWAPGASAGVGPVLVRPSAQELAQAPPPPDPAAPTTSTTARPGSADSAAGQAPSARLDPRLAQASFAGFGTALLLLLLRFFTAGRRPRFLQRKSTRLQG